MISRVLDALLASRHGKPLVICGNRKTLESGDPALASLARRKRLSFSAPASSPSRSAARALARTPPGQPVLLTTADHALLDAGLVDTFCEAAGRQEADVVIGLATLDTVRAGFPGTRRTALRFRDGRYCGCNLFAFLTPAGRQAIGFWQRLETQRKRPWRMAWTLGPVALLLHGLRLWTLEQALAHLSRRCGARVTAVLLDEPRAAVDVDTPADLRLVESVLGVGGPQSS
jgi:CTP:molybdopterin cytidylyltransferase MocA